jgi:Na+/melibiose symporter-like transporter
MPETAVPARSRAILPLALAGVAVALASVVSYFTVVMRWPDLRDSGLPNVALAGVGLLLCLAALLKAFRSRRWRVTGVVLLLLSGLCFSFLTVYIFYLSYKLPSTEGVAALGDKAPEIRLPDQEGRERSLLEFAGRPVFLVFFRGHW